MMESTSAEFLGSSRQERIAKCRAFAAEAERLGHAVNGDGRDRYLGLAEQWSALADEIERNTRDRPERGEE